MVWEGVPWFVNLAEHGPEVARTLAYAAAGGREGVIGAEDLKVTASAIPDGNVHVSPGAAAVLNAAAADGAQGYIARNVGDEVKGLDPQGSSGVRYDLVALVVQDPQYAGQPAPVSVADGPYVITKVYKNVASTTQYLYEVDPNQTGLALALVKFNASDGTVTDSEITDLRRTLFSRQHTDEKIVSITTGQTDVSTSGLAVFPPGSSWEINVPPWATHVNLSAVLSGFDAKDDGPDGGTAIGKMTVELGALVTDDATWRANATGPGRRTTITAQAAQGDIDCRSVAGTRQTLRTRVHTTGGSGMTMRATDGTTCVVRAVFMEKAV